MAVVTIVLLALCVIVLACSLYLYGKYRTHSTTSNDTRTQSRWRHNDGMNKN